MKNLIEHASDIIEKHWERVVEKPKIIHVNGVRNRLLEWQFIEDLYEAHIIDLAERERLFKDLWK